MKSLSQGNKGIQALAKENPTLVENIQILIMQEMCWE